MTRYGRLGASSRVRLLQFLPALKAVEIVVQVQPLLDDEYLRQKYNGRVPWSRVVRSYSARLLGMWRGNPGSVLWIEKELWPWAPAWIECLAWRNRRVVLDYDDAIFHNYDLARSFWVRALFGRKIDHLMARADLVTVGNEYLAHRAQQAGARWVEVLPTVVDLLRYPRPARGGGGSGAVQDTDAITICWIGSPATASYLQQLRAPLRRLAQEHRIRLHVIGGGDVDLPGVEVVPIPWSESTEVEGIARCDIGVMPLNDSPWERGKCGYKLIQYMACGLPVVASPVGVNTQIVRDGQNGYLAADAEDWYLSLQKLVGDAALRARLGAEGRARVEADYCVQVASSRLTRWLRTLGKEAR